MTENSTFSTNIVKNYSESDLDEEKQYNRSISKISFSCTESITNSIKLNDTPLICAISYQPFTCPIQDCKSVLSPSTLISHITFHHRELTLTILSLCHHTTVNISEYFVDLFTRNPTGICGMILKTHRFGPVPLILNICAVSDTNGETGDFDDLSNQWIAIWLSTLYILPYWLTLQLKGPGKRSCFLTYTSKPYLTHDSVTTKTLLESNNVLLVHGKMLKYLYTPEEGICVTIRAHRTFL